MAIEQLSFDSAILNRNTLFMHNVEIIKESSKNIVNNYLKLGKALQEIKNEKLYDLLGYQSIYEFTEKELNFSQTVTKNLIAVYEKFSDQKSNSVELKSEYKNFNYTQLVELVPVDENELSNFNPEMTTKEIRYKKIESKIKNELGKLIEFTKKSLFKEMDNTANKVGLKYTIKIEESEWGCPIEIIVNTMRELGCRFELRLNDTSCCYEIWNRKKYKWEEVDTSISLVMKYFNEFINKVLPLQQEILSRKEAEKKEKAKLKAEGKETSKGRFKNDIEREDFLYSLQNYDLLYDLTDLGIRYYRCKDYPDIIMQTIYNGYHKDYTSKRLYLYESKHIGIDYATPTKQLIEYLKNKDK